MKKTNVLFVLDCSGSMDSCRQATINGFNEQLATLQLRAKDLGETTLTLVVFGTDRGYSASNKFRDSELVGTIYDRVPIHLVPKLSMETYVPLGNTPMYDGIQCGLEKMDLLRSRNKDDNEGNLVMIFTDGQENASKFSSSEAVAALVTYLKGTGTFTFQVLGANIDLASVVKLKLDGDFAQYTSSPIGTQHIYAAVNVGLSNYAASRSRGVASTGNLGVKSTSGGSGGSTTGGST